MNEFADSLERIKNKYGTEDEEYEIAESEDKESREEASFILANIDRRVCDDELNEALDMAIKALEQEPCGDCISRENAIKQCGFGMTSLLIADNLRSLPPVTPQQKTGRWIFDKILDKHYYCSECKSMGVDYWDYCPSCGAKMEG